MPVLDAQGDELEAPYAVPTHLEAHESIGPIPHRLWAIGLTGWVSSSLLLPGQTTPLTEAWQIKEQLDHALDAVIDSGPCGTESTTVIDFSRDRPEVIRKGAGDPARFE